MARQSDSNGRAPLTKHAIVTAARKIISTEGHETLTLRGIATDLGVTAPALYAHFENKEELLRAVVHNEFEWSIAVEWGNSVAHIEDPVDRLRALAYRYVAFARENPQLFRLLLTYPPEFFRRENFEATERPTSLGGRAFRATAGAVWGAIESGRFRYDDPFLVSLILFSAGHGLAVFLLIEPDLGGEFERRFIDSFIDVLFRGLAADSTRKRSSSLPDARLATDSSV